jgi:hypothetical protein
MTYCAGRGRRRHGRRAHPLKAGVHRASTSLISSKPTTLCMNIAVLRCIEHRKDAAHLERSIDRLHVVDLLYGSGLIRVHMKRYGDVGYRVCGRWMRYLCNILQSIQLVLNFGLIIVSTGEALSQAAKIKLCFALCCLVWTIAGFVSVKLVPCRSSAGLPMQPYGLTVGLVRDK